MLYIVYISYAVNTVANARLFTAEFSQLTIFTADCLRHPILMAGIETIWELHTPIVLSSFSAGDWSGHRGVGCCTGVHQVQGWCRVASDVTPPPFDFVFLGFSLD